jgi:tRNA G18 (ribose-2'-O)-methylase SpoU
MTVNTLPCGPPLCKVPTAMRGYFGIGVEGISKQMNAGSLLRSAHAFGASFFFSLGPAYSVREGRHSDTSGAEAEIPVYTFAGSADLRLPKGCRLVGVELTDEAVDLPSFCDPRRAAYVLGSERGALSPELTEACAFVVKIPTKFCINVGVAGAIVMYDRLIHLGRFASRPLIPGGAGEEPPAPVFGPPVLRRKRRLQDDRITVE